MSRAESLMALAERVEKEPASRELSAEIVAALVGGTMKVSPYNGNPCIYRGESRRGEPALWEPAYGNAMEKVLRPIYLDLTHSLDAVKALEKPEWAIEISHPNRRECICRVITYDYLEDLGRSIVDGDHAEPRARLAAILRALAGSEHHD